MLRYYFHLDPEKLSDEEWTARWQELRWIREEERRSGISLRL